MKLFIKNITLFEYLVLLTNIVTSIYTVNLYLIKKLVLLSELTFLHTC